MHDLKIENVGVATPAEIADKVYQKGVTIETSGGEALVAVFTADFNTMQVSIGTHRARLKGDDGIAVDSDALSPEEPVPADYAHKLAAEFMEFNNAMDNVIDSRTSLTEE